MEIKFVSNRTQRNLKLRKLTNGIVFYQFLHISLLLSIGVKISRQKNYYHNRSSPRQKNIHRKRNAPRLAMRFQPTRARFRGLCVHNLPAHTNNKPFGVPTQPFIKTTLNSDEQMSLSFTCFAIDTFSICSFHKAVPPFRICRWKCYLPHHRLYVACSVLTPSTCAAVDSS